MQNILAQKEKLTILFDQGVVSGVNFSIGILLTQFLGLEEYGLFALAWMVVLFTSSLHLAFVIKPLYTLYPKQDDKKEYLASLMGIQLLFSLITFIVVFALITAILKFYPAWGRPYIALNLSGIASLFIFQDYLRRLFFAQHRPFAALLMDLLGYGLQPILLYILYRQQMLSLTSTFAMLNIVFSLSILTAILVSYRYGLQYVHLKKTLKKNWQFSKYLLGTGLLQWFSGNLFIAVAGGILGPIAVGAVRIGQNIVGVLHVLFLAMENIVPVRAAELLTTKGEKSMFKYMGKITLQGAIPAIGLLALVLIFKDTLITTLYGAEYIRYDFVLMAFCGLYVLVYMGTLLRFVIRTLENNKIIFISYIITTIASLILVQPIVSQYGISGVLMGLFLVQLLSLSVYIYALRADLKWIFK